MIVSLTNNFSIEVNFNNYLKRIHANIASILRAKQEKGLLKGPTKENSHHIDFFLQLE